MRSRSAAIAVLCVAGAFAACTDDGPPPNPTTVPTPKAALALEPFGGCDELRRRHARMLTREVLNAFERCWGCSPNQRYPHVQAGAPGEVLDPGADAAERIVVDFDTGYAYVADFPRDLLVIDVIPAEDMAIVSRQATSPEHSIAGLYLDADADRLVVLAVRTDTLHSDIFFGFRWVVEVEFYDIADPVQPVLVDRYDIVGDLRDARRTGQRLHVATSMRLELPSSLRLDVEFTELQSEYYDALSDGSEARAAVLGARLRARIKDAVAATPLEELLPAWRQGLVETADFTTLACTDVLRPNVELSPGIAVISSIDTDGSDLTHTALLHSSRRHAGARDFYLFQDSGRWWHDPSQLQQTAIYRFGIGASGPAQLSGFAVVDGWIPREFGPSEHDGYLRVAASEERYAQTMTSGYQQWDIANRVLVLGPAAEGPFEVVGEVPFLSHQWIGETRFIGDRGFAWADSFLTASFPSFMTFDLSDPADPRIAGSLSLAANAAYLHPNGDDGVFAIAQRAIGVTWQPEVELQSLDMTDPALPQPLDGAVIGQPDGQAWSRARDTPRSFALLGDLLSVPVEIRAPAFEDSLSGFVVYRVTAPGGLEEIGRVDHKGPDAPSFSSCGPYRSQDIPPCETLARVSGGAPARSLRIDEPGGRTVLYTLSERYLKADEVLADSLVPIGTVPLTE